MILRAALCLLLALATAAGEAAAAVPTDVAADIAAAAERYRADLRRSKEVAERSGDSGLAAAIADSARLAAGEAAAAAVVGGIARHPAEAEEIVAAAVRALPDRREAIVAGASRAFPGFAETIRAAAAEAAKPETPALPPAPAKKESAAPVPAPRMPDARRSTAPQPSGTTERPPAAPEVVAPKAEAPAPENAGSAAPEPAASEKAEAATPKLPADWREKYKVEDRPPDVAPVPAPRQSTPPDPSKVRAFTEPAPPTIHPVPMPGSGGAERAPAYAKTRARTQLRPFGPAPIPDPVEDPIEGVNRAVFAFNDVLDRFVIKPVAQAYGYVMPGVAKRAVRRAFTNLESPIVLANDLLQLEPEDAMVTTGRFVINSTAGVAGLFDVASELGIEGHPADFGQTLHAYGSGPGPYLVLPVLGPTTLRDGAGRAVDVFFQPLTYLLDFWFENFGLVSGKGLTEREALIEPLDELRKTSIDFYAAVRSAYYQDRAQALRRGRPADASQLDAEFDALN